MPLYEFICPKCGYVTEKMVSVANRDDVFECPNCKVEIKRAIALPSRTWAPTRNL